MLRILVYLREESQPQHRHAPQRDGWRQVLGIGLGGKELRQLHEYEAQTLDDAVGVGHVDNGIVVVELLGAGIETYVVDEVERIHWLQQRVVLALVKLLDNGLGGIQNDTTLELVVPIHLHLHDEMAATRLAAAHIDDAVLLQGCLRHQLLRQVLHALYLLPLV